MISATLVKELRDKTDAGMMDCKKALEATNGDLNAAIDWLRIKGINSAAKRADRDATEGAVISYVHSTGKIGVMLELGCETDFVARNQTFLDFGKDIAMHITASNPKYVSVSDISENDREQEKNILVAKAKESGKPDAIIQKMIEGQIKKWSAEICLLEQPFVKNTDVTIKEHVNAMIAKLGENIVIRRFVKFTLGEK